MKGINQLVILLLLLLTVLTSLAACSSIEKPTYEQYNSHEVTDNKTPVNNGNFIEADVLSITDGDTLKVSIKEQDLSGIQNNIRKEKLRILLAENNGVIYVRFLAIDTPEITKGKTELYGQEAKNLVEYLLSDDKVIIQMDPNAFTDDYGRLLGHIFTSDRESVQLALLESGLARVAYLNDDYLYIEEYKSASERAKNAGIGIFSINDYVTDSGFDMKAISQKNKFDILSVGEVIKYLENLEIGDIIDIVDNVKGN